jgi:hypothetical protein
MTNLLLVECVSQRSCRRSVRARTNASDEYSQIETTSTQLNGGQQVGAAVRA